MNLDENNLSELSQHQNTAALSMNVGAGTSRVRQPSINVLFHSHAQGSLVHSVNTFKDFTKSHKNSANLLNDGNVTNESPSSQCSSIESKATFMKESISVENVSGGTPLNNFRHNICNSPESGFGSEHQYSPRHIDANNINNVVAHAKMSENIPSHTYQSFSNKDRGSNEEVIQIVNISSLAQAISKDDKKKKISLSQSCTKSVQVEHISTVPTKRLCILHSGNKRALHFDPILSKDCNMSTNRDFCIPITSISSSLSTPYYHISFSGLPVIAKRKHYVLSKEGIDGFVSSLAKHTPRKVSGDQHSLHSNALSSSKITYQKCHDNSQKVTTKVCQDISDLPLKTEGMDNSDIYSIIKGNDLHSSSMVSVRENTPSKRKFSEISVKAITSLPSSTSSASLNTKADKIKRLKEIIKQREEDLEKVRKNCGFIS